MSDHPTVEQLSALIDGELSLAAREAVIAHVRACPSCAARQDALIEVAADLQTRAPVSWSRSDTQSVLVRIRAEQSARRHTRRERDWSLPIAGAFALVAVIAFAVVAPTLVSAGLGGSSFDAISALTSQGGLISGHFILALTVVAAIGIAAVPLVRKR